MEPDSRKKAGLRGVRWIALFEAAKGGIVVLAGFGVLSLIHEDLQTAAEHLVARLHLNPAKNLGHVFMDVAMHMGDGRLQMMALLASLYAVMRFIEAYGLWRGRRWAEWFAVVSGGIYLPFELFELSRGISWLTVTAVVVNLLIVIYLFSVMRKSPNAVGQPDGPVDFGAGAGKDM